MRAIISCAFFNLLSSEEEIKDNMLSVSFIYFCKQHHFLQNKNTFSQNSKTHKKCHTSMLPFFVLPAMSNTPSLSASSIASHIINSTALAVSWVYTWNKIENQSLQQYFRLCLPFWKASTGCWIKARCRTRPKLNRRCFGRETSGHVLYRFNRFKGYL